MKTIQDRFFDKVEKKDSGCHEWKGRIQPNGYGQFRNDGKTQYAHRVAYELANGPFDEGHIMHKCDNRKCVNPDHLMLGTRADNMRDMTSKLRQCHGERNAHSKLTAEQVRKIRAEAELDSSRGRVIRLAKKFGISYSVVSEILARKIWVHV